MKEKIGRFLKKHILPIFTTLLTLLTAGSLTLNLSNRQTNIEINQLIASHLGMASPSELSDDDVKSHVELYIQQTEETRVEEKKNSAELNALRMEVQTLKAENQALQDEHSVIKDILFQNDPGIKDIRELLEEKQTKDHLFDLHANDLKECELVDGVYDYKGDYHSKSYQLNYGGYGKWKLGQKYDLLSFGIATSTATREDVEFSIEIYVDDELVRRVDGIRRETGYVPVKDIPVHNGDILEIKQVVFQGNYSCAVCYITDDTLSVVD